MFVCLSSGYRPRYLRDIVRSLALPKGAWLAFRYNRVVGESPAMQLTGRIEGAVWKMTEGPFT